MPEDRLERIAVAFATSTAVAESGQLCAACATLLDVSGVGITLMGGAETGPVCSSDERIRVLEDLQFTVGEGPCREAYKDGVAVLEPHLGLVTETRWPSFVEMATSIGIGGVFAYPLMRDGAKVGVLTIYQDTAGPLSVAQSKDSVAVARVLTRMVLSMQAVTAPGTIAPGLDEAVAHRAEVHQAAGMVALQLMVPVAEALVRIRAHAFGSGEPIDVVAARIVSGELRLSNDHEATDD